MANSIAIVAPSGFGKSTSLAEIPDINHKGLNPQNTLIVNVKNKPLPFRGWKQSFKPIKTKEDMKTGNYLATSDFGQIKDTLKFFNENRPEITNVVVDDFQYLMADSYMRDALKSGFDKFNKLGKNTYDVLNTGINMRDDVNFIILTHSEIVESTDFGSRMKMKTIGKMLDDKVNLEGLFTIVLYGKSEYDSKSQTSKKLFVTNFDGQFPAKSPLGMFDELYIPNDLGYVIEKMNEYNQG